MKKIRRSRPVCNKTNVPKCRTSDAAEQIRLCSVKVKSRKAKLQATVYEAEMVTR